MKSHASLRRALLLLALALFVAAPARAQQPAAQRSAAPPARGAQAAPNVTFDTLLAADSYAIYGELRSVGAYVNSKEVTELLAPAGLPGGAPPELLDLFNFLRAHADELATARVMFAGMPVRPKLPDGFAAVELSSPEQAQKFEAQLRKFMTTHAAAFFGEPGDNAAQGATTTATATTTTATLGGPSAIVGARRAGPSANARAGERAPAAAAPKSAPFQLVRAGALLVLSDKAFTLAAFHPADAPLLSDEPGFQAARARFPHETVFVYFNTRRIERSAERERKAAEARQRAELERARKAAENDPKRAATIDTQTATLATQQGEREGRATPTPEEHPTGNESAVTTRTEMVAVPMTTNIPVPPDVAQTQPQNAPPPAADEHGRTPEEEAQAEQRRAAEQLISTLPMLLFGNAPGFGGNNWPESIAAAAELEDDALVLRALLVKEADERPARPLPFLPLLMSGPALTPEAPNVVPADTDVLISASLDLPQMYDYVASMLKLFDAAASVGGGNGANKSFDAQLGAFERAGNFRIKEDLLAALGNELAVAVPGRFFGVGRGDGAATRGAARTRGPIFFVALNDKKALQALLPRALEAAGLKGVTTQQLIERRGDAELLAFAPGNIAFIDRFLVVAPDADTMRHVIDSYNERRTLATSEEFRNSAHWQPRQLLAQIYVSNALLKSTFEDPKVALEEIDDATVRDVLMRTNPEPGAITHALSKDDQGMMHELHIPKDALALMAADALVSRQLGPLRAQEGQARYALQGLAAAEEAYKRKHGKYASLEELKRLAEEAEKKSEADEENNDGDEDEEGGFISYAEGYDIRLNFSGDKFEATATPAVYRKTGRRSFYIDQTGVLRGADTGGKPADVSAPPVD